VDRQAVCIEAGIKDKPPDHKLAVRQAQSVPLLAQFHQWLQGNANGLLTKPPLAQAFGYALRHWQALMRYTKSGILEPDNNRLERGHPPDCRW
jgi:hypothetical protein